MPLYVVRMSLRDVQVCFSHSLEYASKTIYYYTTDWLKISARVDSQHR